jgi:hypothetical protein
MNEPAQHIVRTHAITIRKPMPLAFECFTPEGERAWAEGWDPEWRWPPDGRTRAGMVFTTGHGGEHTIWALTRLEPEQGLVEYVRATPGSRVGLVRVCCTPVDEGSTRVEVRYALTALSSQGREKLAALDEAAFAGFIESWREAIDRRTAP